MFPIETTFVAHDNNKVLTVKLRHKTSLVAYSTDKRSKTKKLLSLFRTKGNQNVNPFDYLNQYFNTKMAIIVESIYLGTKIISLQIKAHEVYIKPLKPRESILEIKESGDEDESDNDDNVFDVLDKEN